jgi:subtilisin family serine protease
MAAVALLGAAAPAHAARGLPTPADPAFAQQWQLADDAAMGVRTAWRSTTGGDVTVAVVDTGADLTHPDLVPNLWTNPGEIPGNGIDDDGNGYVDDVHGYDFVGHDGSPDDENGHGTHVAGIIGARGANRLGVTGVAWRVKLMIVRSLGADGRGDLSDLATGIRYAVRNGARIVNLSVAGSEDDPDLEAALAEAQAAGVLVVAAAGNQGVNLDVQPAYPAASAAPNLISVASTDRAGALAQGSSYGSGSVDLSAPGEDIESTSSTGGFELRSGTSQAAAEVTGALALLAAARPAAGWPAWRSALLDGARRTAVPVASGALDVGAALRRLGVAPRATRASRARARAKARTSAKR